jgi:hypothetical protein
VHRKETTDLFFAAYCVINGHKVIDFSKLSVRKGKFIFDIADEDYKKLKLEFTRSDISKIKQTIEELKDLLF